MQGVEGGLTEFCQLRLDPDAGGGQGFGEV